MPHTDLTVAAIVQRDDHYLLVEERTSRGIIFGQPGGHIESGESPEEALIREVLEETGCQVDCGELVGVYLWIRPDTQQQFLRIIYVANFLACNESQALDDGVIARHWLTRDEIQRRGPQLRSPVVMRCIRDFEAGRRESGALLSGMAPLSRNVERVMARAHLV